MHWPEWHMGLDVRYEPQFGCRGEDQRDVFVFSFSVTYLDFLVPTKKQTLH